MSRSASPGAGPEAGGSDGWADGESVDAVGRGVPLGAVSCGEGAFKFSLLGRRRPSNPLPSTIM